MRSRVCARRDLAGQPVVGVAVREQRGERGEPRLGAQHGLVRETGKRNLPRH